MQQAPRATETLIAAAALYLDHAPARTKPVTVAVSSPVRRAAPGDRVDVSFTVTVAEGWHINGGSPREDTLAPTTVRLEADGVAVLEEISYPEGTEYRGTLEIRGTIRVGPEAPPGPAELVFEIGFQPCDESRCLASEILTCPLSLEISRP
jgi:hypothetical protein